jgi:hypothetical protein
MQPAPRLRAIVHPQLTNGIVGALSAVVDADLEGIVAKHLADAYHPKLARWHKILNRTYSQRLGRAEWFRERRGRRGGWH